MDAQLSVHDLVAGRRRAAHPGAAPGDQGVPAPQQARRASQPGRAGARAGDAEAVGDLHGQADGGSGLPAARAAARRSAPLPPDADAVRTERDGESPRDLRSGAWPAPVTADAGAAGPVDAHLRAPGLKNQSARFTIASSLALGTAP